MICKNCGAELEANAGFCPNCGLAVEIATAPNGNDTEDAPRVQPGSGKKKNGFDPKDVEANKVMAILAYLSWLVLIPIFAAKDSRFARFHANQGLSLAILEIAWWIVESIVSSILLSISWRLAFVSTILGLVNLLFVVLTIMGILNAANGKAKKLPIVGNWRILK